MNRAQTKQRRPTSRNGRTHHSLVDYFRGGTGPVGLRGGGLTGVCGNGTGETRSGEVRRSRAAATLTCKRCVMKRWAVWAAVGVPVMVTIRLVVPSAYSPRGETTTFAPDNAMISRIVEPCRPKMLPMSSSGTDSVMVVSVTGRDAASADSLRGSPRGGRRWARDSAPSSPSVEVRGDVYVVPRLMKGMISDCCTLRHKDEGERTARSHSGGTTAVLPREACSKLDQCRRCSRPRCQIESRCALG